MMDYELMNLQVEGYLEEEPYFVSALSNISALLFESLPDLNWAGFYLMHEGKLTVGPFQGKPACIHIAPGKGVCGTSVERNQTMLIPDVHQFPGHIACDSASNSEIVIPLHDPKSGRVLGVMDIDSPRFDRFSEEDRIGLERIARTIEAGIKWQ